MRLLRSSACILLVLGAGFGPARAADAPVRAPAVPASDWNGFYLGGHAGFVLGHTEAAAGDSVPDAAHHTFGTNRAGLQAGFNLVLSPGLLIGVEADATFPGYIESNGYAIQIPASAGSVAEHTDYHGTFRGRLGHVADNWLFYGTAGLAFMGSTVTHQPIPDVDEQTRHMRRGWAAGAGVEYALGPSWTARLEYLYSRFGTTTVRFPAGTASAAGLDVNQWRFGLNWRLGDPIAWPKALSNPSESSRWELHGQTTYIQQGYPAFHAPYSGKNSLAPWAQARNTWTASAFLGVRLWDGGELYYNPDLLQGFGLSDTLGLAGFSNGEAQKSDFPYPHYNTARLFLRQTWGLGGAQETLESGPNQLSGKVDVSRITVQAGRFPVSDLFDGNAYARDPRTQFMNWSIWAAGAFDYAADKLGYGYGATVELNQKNWAVRGGYFLMDATSNSNDFDMNLFRRGEYLVELEMRYRLFSRPGKLRAIAFVNSAFAGSYRATLDNPALDIAQTRRTRYKYGYGFNLEQSITDDVGLFGRWSWNNGKNEIMAFTDIDASLSGGLSVKGRGWGRPDDTIGLAGAVNAISKDHREFIAAGGLGPLIGDGRLNYRTERILETYYSVALMAGTTFTFDYQFVVNPAYNADRGPVNVFSARLHAEF